MTNERLALAAVTFTFAVAASACDAQTTPEYPGSKLLTIHGTIAGELTDEEIVPALAFTDLNFVTQTTYLVDLDVEGEFPTRFSARVYDAPPAGAVYIPPAAFGPAGASASIVAVRAGHPATIVDRFRSESESCGATCVREKSVYGDDGQTVVYHERTVCDANWANCETTATGDASAGVTLADVFRGVVSNYHVIYLAKDVSNSTPSLAAAAYGPLSAGYHLISQRVATDAEIAEMTQCESDAMAKALADFNAQHGTSYTTGEQVAAADPALAEQLGQRAWSEFVARGCRLNNGFISTPVVTDRDNPVTMQISNDSSLIDGSYP
jgi:hypothetical protein